MKKKAFLPVILVIFLGFGFFIGRLSVEKETITMEAVVDREYYPVVHSLIKEARKSIHIVMFEFFYYPEYPESYINILSDDIVTAKRGGVDVKIIVEGGEDFLGDNFRKKVMKVIPYFKENEVSIRFDPVGVTTHSKLIIVDGETVVVGSTNWTYYAFDKNYETNVLIKSKVVASDFEKYFNKLWTLSTPSELEKIKLSQKPFSKIGDILQNRDYYDGKSVNASGIVKNMKLKVSKKGNPYATFSVDDGVNEIKVFTFGHPHIKEGGKVTVEGVFKKEKKVGGYTFYNEIEAKKIE